MGAGQDWSDIITNEPIVEIIQQFPEDLIARLSVEPRLLLRVWEEFAPLVVELLQKTDAAKAQWSMQEFEEAAGVVLEQLLSSAGHSIEGFSLDSEYWHPPFTVLALAHAVHRGVSVAGLRQRRGDTSVSEMAEALLDALRTQNEPEACRIVREALRRGADFTRTKVDGSPLVHAVAELGMEALLTCLLDEAGVDPHQTESGEFTPVDAAFRGASEGTARLLMDRGVGYGLNVFELLRDGGPQLVGPVETLLKLKPQVVRSTDELGYTLLHWAKDPQMVRVLLDAGADVGAVNVKGVQPLHAFIISRRPAASIQLLVAAGADVHAELPDGPTPLFWAVKNGDPEVVEILLKAGADPDRGASRVSMKTTRQLIAESKQPDMVALFASESNVPAHSFEELTRIAETRDPDRLLAFAKRVASQTTVDREGLFVGAAAMSLWGKASDNLERGQYYYALQKYLAEDAPSRKFLFVQRRLRETGVELDAEYARLMNAVLDLEAPPALSEEFDTAECKPPPIHSVSRDVAVKEAPHEVTTQKRVDRTVTLGAAFFVVALLLLTLASAAYAH